MAGDDRQLTVCNEEGDTVCQCNLKGEASLVQFAQLQLPDSKLSNGDNCVSLLLNRKSLFLLCLADSDSPIVLSFQDKYGKIVDYHWSSNGFILVGFTVGYLVIVSTNPKDLGQEVSVVRAHPESLVTFAFSEKTNQVSTCSENM